MLRITENKDSSEIVSLRLEGQISNHGVEITREACEQMLKQGSQLRLDVAGVTFVDRAGVALLHELQRREVKVMNCSPFLREQLKVTS